MVGFEQNVVFHFEYCCWIFPRDDLLVRADVNSEQFLYSFVILSTHYLVGGLARGSILLQFLEFVFYFLNIVERTYFTDVINVGKLFLKYLLQNLLPKSNELTRVNFWFRKRDEKVMFLILVADIECN